MELQIVLAIVTACITGIVSWFVYKLQKRESRLEQLAVERERQQKLQDEAVSEALRALCRDRIFQGYRYYNKHSGISAQDLETMTKLYNAYHALGGNGTMTAVYEKILSLPIKEE